MTEIFPFVILCFLWTRGTIACQDQQNKKSRGDCRQDQETGGAGYLHGSAAEERPHDHAGGISHHKHRACRGQIAALETLPHLEHTQGVVAADRTAPHKEQRSGQEREVQIEGQERNNEG